MVNNTRKPAYNMELQQQILHAFKGEIDPVKVSFSYQIGLVLVTGMMLLLPMLYLALIAAFVYMLFYYTTHFGDFFPEVRGRAAIFLLGTPLIVGVICLAFMIKPLFVRPVEEYMQTSLDPKKEPLLFAFVNRLAQIVGAPPPKEIVVNMEVNASASLRRGLLSMFSSDLTLTVGLPLTGGLNMSQFAGILAHEFGHFAQTTGMRLTYIVRSINYWFYQVVYTRDKWDRKLDELCEDSEILMLMIAAWLSKPFIWLVRKIFWVLMQMGHLVSSLMSRQMEFDADRYEARLVGTDVFEATSRELSLLFGSQSMAHEDQYRYWQTGILCEDLSALTMFHRGAMDRTTQRKIQGAVDRGETSWDASHPCDRDRIANVRKDKRLPVFASDLPASSLFRNFDEMSKSLTQSHYYEAIGGELFPNQFRTIKALKEKDVILKGGGEVVTRFFGGSVHDTSLPRLVYPNGTPKNASQVENALSKLQTQLKERERETLPVLGKIDKYRERHDLRRQAALLVKLDWPFTPREFEVSSATKEGVARDLAQTEAALDRYLATRQAYADVVGKKLGLLLSLLRIPRLAQQIEDAPTRVKRLKQWLSAYKCLGAQQEQWSNLENCVQDFLFLKRLWEATVEEEDEDDGLIEEIKHTARDFHNLMSELRSALGASSGIPPQEEGEQETDLARYLFPSIPPSDDYPGLHNCFEKAINRFREVRQLMLIDLAKMGEELETVWGRMVPQAAKPE